MSQYASFSDMVTFTTESGSLGFGIRAYIGHIYEADDTGNVTQEETKKAVEQIVQKVFPHHAIARKLQKTSFVHAHFPFCSSVFIDTLFVLMPVSQG